MYKENLSYTKKTIFLLLIVYALVFSLFLLRAFFITHDSLRSNTELFYIYFFSIFIFSLSIIFFKKSIPHFTKEYFIYIFILACLLRICALFSYPFSTDLYRYLSDGLNLISGQNPYISPVIGENISFPQYKAIYPLGAQLFFGIGTYFYKNIFIFKFLFGIFELLLIFWYWFYFIYHRKNQANRKYFILFFLLMNPCIIFEFYAEGHLEIASILFFTVSSFLLHSKKIFKGFIVSSMSFLSKLHGIFLFPFFIKNFFLKKQYIIFILLVIILYIGMLPYIFQVEYKVESGMFQYLKHWYFNHPIHYLLSLFISSSSIIIKIQQVSLTLLLSIIYIYGLLKKKSIYYILKRVILCFLILFPVQHPWYFSLLIYLILFSRNTSIYYMLLFLSMGFTYLQYVDSKELKVFAIFLPWVIFIIYYLMFNLRFPFKNNSWVHS